MPEGHTASVPEPMLPPLEWAISPQPSNGFEGWVYNEIPKCPLIQKTNNHPRGQNGSGIESKTRQEV